MQDIHKGYLSLVLHAHLPFVRHPEEKQFLEESWLYEAITETYLPLLDVFERLVADGVHFRITMSLTPPLAAMLRDPLLQERYLRHLHKLIELSEKEIERTAYQPAFHGLALMYNKRYTESLEAYEGRYKRDLVAAFGKFQDLGVLEILASCATHGFLPNLNVNPKSVEAQVRIGVDCYQKAFGRPPRGFWLPECGYYAGVDQVLRDAGLRYFIIDSHGILHADPAPRYAVYAPLYCPSGVAAFGRDWESSKQVWSAKEGYPGDPDYREYYRDIGHELELDYIRPYIHDDDLRVNTGLKYWRITGHGDHKEPYNPDWAREKAASHAGNFMFNREKQIEFLSSRMDRRPLILAPYDAELFGHWWFEGPMWLDFLIRKIVYDQKTVKLATPSDYLAEYPENQMAQPSPSSWGYKGYSEVWLEDGNDWIYRHLHAIGRRMVELADRFYGKKGLTRRALNQAARELVLAESSDWPFIIKMGTMVPYAQRRLKMHIGRFNRLYDDLLAETVDEDWLKEVERRDNYLSDVDCAAYYLSKRPPAKKGGKSHGQRKARTKKGK